MRYLMPLLVVTLCTALFTPALAAEDLAGRWSGPIRLLDNGVSEAWVNLVIEKAEDGWTGTVSIVAITDRVDLSEISMKGERVTLLVRGVPGNPTFNGILAGDKLSGDFRHGGKTFPFLLRRVTKR